MSRLGTGIQQRGERHSVARTETGNAKRLRLDYTHHVLWYARRPDLPAVSVYRIVLHTTVCIVYYVEMVRARSPSRVRTQRPEEQRVLRQSVQYIYTDTEEESVPIGGG